MRLFPHSFFQAGYWLALSQYYEYLFSLVERGLETHLWFSGTGLLHHGYMGFIIIYLMYLYLTWQDYKMINLLFQAESKEPWYKKLIFYLLF